MDTFVIPDGKATGCLPRVSRPGELFPMAGEKITLIDRKDWSRYAGKVSLRPFVRDILDQDGRGSCATESTTQGVMVSRACAGLPHVLLNPWSIYWKTSGGADRGSSIDTNLDYILKYGICPEALHPRSKGAFSKPSDEAMKAALEFCPQEVYDISTVDEMVSSLLTGYAVVYGAAGHSVLKIEHVDDSHGLDVNSWGKSWGDGGFGTWASYRGVNWGYGAFAIRW